MRLCLFERKCGFAEEVVYVIAVGFLERARPVGAVGIELAQTLYDAGVTPGEHVEQFATPGSQFKARLASWLLAASDRRFGIFRQCGPSLLGLGLHFGGPALAQAGELLFGVVLCHPVFSGLHLNHLDDLSEWLPIGLSSGADNFLGAFDGHDGAVEMIALVGQDLALMP